MNRRGFMSLVAGLPLVGKLKFENNVWYVLESTVPEWMSD
jgi:hypothetical protein